MRAKLTDKTVCLRCNGTGTSTFKIAGYSYAIPCLAPIHAVLPIDDPDLVEVCCGQCLGLEAKANLSDCLICIEFTNACSKCITKHQDTHTEAETATAYAELCQQ